MPAERHAGAGTDERPLEALRVLLVEDNAAMQEVVAWLLEASGAKVTAAASVAEALQALEAGWPEVIVSDIGLPGENGYVLLDRVRARAAERGRPAPLALALTAFARNEDRERALAAGFAAYAAKPIEPQALLDAIVALARRARA